MSRFVLNPLRHGYFEQNIQTPKSVTAGITLDKSRVSTLTNKHIPLNRSTVCS